jgi:hypothetical protein
MVGVAALKKSSVRFFFSVGSTDLANSPELLQGGDFAYAVRMFTGQFHGFTKNQDRHVARLMVLQIEPKNDLQSC